MFLHLDEAASTQPKAGGNLFTVDVLGQNILCGVDENLWASRQDQHDAEENCIMISPLCTNIHLQQTMSDVDFPFGQ